MIAEPPASPPRRVFQPRSASVAPSRQTNWSATLSYPEARNLPDLILPHKPTRRKAYKDSNVAAGCAPGREAEFSLSNPRRLAASPWPE
jgi:hypothetical protein